MCVQMQGSFCQRKQHYFGTIFLCGQVAHIALAVWSFFLVKLHNISGLVTHTVLPNYADLLYHIE